jgi:hypothetical protein
MRSVMLALVGLALAVGAHAGAVDLTAKNFDAEVMASGKSAFVKFLAPWLVPDTTIPSRAPSLYLHARTAPRRHFDR